MLKIQLESYVESCVENLCGRVEWEYCVKGVSENVVENSTKKNGWPDQVEKLSGKICQESCVEKWYGTIELTICLKNWMTNLVNKFDGKFV